MIEKELFIVGPARCATSLLHSIISIHPKVCAPRVKEPLFFESQWDQGVNWYVGTYYDKIGDGCWLLDSRHRHFVLDFAQSRIKRTVSDPRFVVVLRDPFRRSFSHWWHWAERLVEPRPFYQAVREEMEMIGDGRAEAISRWPEAYQVERRRCPARGYSREFEMYIYYSLYARHIDCLKRRFGDKSVLVLRFEDVTKDPRWAYCALCQYLGLEVIDGPDLREIPVQTMNRSIHYELYEALYDHALRRSFSSEARALLQEEYSRSLGMVSEVLVQ